jgi:hypothetical protein
VDFYASISSKCRGCTWVTRGRERLRGGAGGWGVGCTYAWERRHTAREGAYTGEGEVRMPEGRHALESQGA